jgi:geranylgeranyl diphosphate synthase type II
MNFEENLRKWSDIVSNELERLVPESEAPQSSVYEAMRYSLLAGGKRIRPVLALAVCELLGGNIREVLPYACAIEMIHNYSLIHDDLPAMDNDDYRRGIPTNHNVFGEAIAILAGDALLNKAFEVMLKDAAGSKEKLREKVKAAEIIAQSSGTEGMIGGQLVDLESEGIEITAETLQYMHRHKTGALITAPVLVAAIICGASEEEYSCLCEYSENIGLAFQIKDDIMDVESSFEEMGKEIGSDSANQKSTFVSLFGIEKAKQMLNDTLKKADNSLQIFGDKASFLRELAEYIGNRKS